MSEQASNHDVVAGNNGVAAGDVMPPVDAPLGGPVDMIGPLPLVSAELIGPVAIGGEAVLRDASGAIVPKFDEQGKPIKIGYSRGGMIAPIANRFKKGNKFSVRKSCAFSTTEWINIWNGQMAMGTMSLQKLRDKYRSGTIELAQMFAIRAIFDALGEDIAMFDKVIDGRKTLREARDEDGVNTLAVKRMKTKTRTVRDANGQPVTETEREIELHDHRQAWRDVMDYTGGKPVQKMQVEHGGGYDINFTFSDAANSPPIEIAGESQADDGEGGGDADNADNQDGGDGSGSGDGGGVSGVVGDADNVSQ